MESPRAIRIPLVQDTLSGDLAISPQSTGLVVFVHGSGSSRLSPRNRHVADVLQKRGLGTLLFDLFTPEEESKDWETGELRFDIPFLTDRLLEVVEWLQPQWPHLRLGYFGSSTGGAAALSAAALCPEYVHAVVSRGGRPDLAENLLPRVKAPTLLIVGGDDSPVLEWNEDACRLLTAPKELAVIPGATHLFEEPGALDKVALLAADWFSRYLMP